MLIQQQKYFDYALPALFFLFAGAFIFNKDISITDSIPKINKQSANKLGLVLVAISYSFDAASFFGIGGLSSFLSFTHYLKYVGAMALLFSPSLLSYFLILLAGIGLASDAIRGGVFIDFFMWSTYFFCVVCLKFKLPFSLRIFFAIFAIPLLVTIQSVKQEYRKVTWSGQEDAEFDTFADLAEQANAKSKNKGWTNSTGVVRTIGRLNQGWHLGLVLRWVPKQRAFSDGEEFIGDLVGTAVPRILIPNKKIIGGQDKFHEFTGHKLRGSTSMTIGVLGDFYINFGRVGSFVGLFIFGAIVSRLLYGFIKNHVLDDPINLVWIPFLFSYLGRANNDFYIVINSLVKGYIIFLAVTFIRKRF
jgi:hypothetical protein